MTKPRWNLRVTNNCLFVDDAESKKIVLQHNARPGLRPYIHPLRGPDGVVCLTEDSPWHHPWQHGIATGFHGVNGCDFWFDPGQAVGVAIGFIEPSTPRVNAQDPPCWEIASVWKDMDEKDLMIERQTWTLGSVGELLSLDLDWKLQAVPDIHIEQASYGGLFVRMPYRASCTADVLNADGMHDEKCEQMASHWVDLFMTVEQSPEGVGISIFDHPDNPGHPTHWRVDKQRGINPSPCIPSAIELGAGEALNHRYRLLLREGSLKPEQIDEQWSLYAAAPSRHG